MGEEFIHLGQFDEDHLDDAKAMRTEALQCETLDAIDTLRQKYGAKMTGGEVLPTLLHERPTATYKKDRVKVVAFDDDMDDSEGAIVRSRPTKSAANSSFSELLASAQRADTAFVQAQINTEGARIQMETASLNAAYAWDAVVAELEKNSGFALSRAGAFLKSLEE
jgi:phage terminase large subunit-like protein